MSNIPSYYLMCSRTSQYEEQSVHLRAGLVSIRTPSSLRVFFTQVQRSVRSSSWKLVPVCGKIRPQLAYVLLGLHPGTTQWCGMVTRKAFHVLVANTICDHCNLYDVIDDINNIIQSVYSQLRYVLPNFISFHHYTGTPLSRNRLLSREPVNQCCTATDTVEKTITALP